MMSYFSVGAFNIPVYGFLALMGTVVCNFIAMWISRADREKWKNYCLIEMVAGTGAVFGAKALTLLSDAVGGSGVGFTWENCKETGYSYYGGLAGFFFFAGILIKICSMDRKGLEKKFLFLLPLQHSLWKIGCLMGGCCYGIPYNGLLAVCYPEGVNEMAGIPVFPVQMLEAVLSLCLSGIIFAVSQGEKKIELSGLFLVLYGLFRFWTEFLRYHENAGFFYIGQKYSLVCIGAGLIWMYKNYRRKIEE